MTGSFYEAENRVREMNRIQQQYLEQSNRQFGRPAQTAVVTPPRFEPPAEEKITEKPTEQVHPAEKGGGNVQNNHNKTNSTGIDSEKLLIMALIFLLLKEKADIKIILALAYLLT